MIDWSDFASQIYVESSDLFKKIREITDFKLNNTFLLLLNWIEKIITSTNILFVKIQLSWVSVNESDTIPD